MNCHKCGLEIEEGDVFCGRCGASIESSQVIDSKPVVRSDSQTDINNQANSASNDLNITNNAPGLAKTLTFIRRKRVGGIISLIVVVIITAAIFVSFTKSSANQIKSETSAPVVTTQSATSSATTSVADSVRTDLLDQIQQNSKNRVISGGQAHALGITKDAYVVAAGLNNSGECNVSSWSNVVSVSAGCGYSVGLKNDGSVVATGFSSEGNLDVSQWKDIVSIDTAPLSFHTVGLKSDGTVVAVGGNQNGQCDVSTWQDIIGIAVGSSYTYGLKSNGTVTATKFEGGLAGTENVKSWTNITSIDAGMFQIVGLRDDGTVVASGLVPMDENYQSQISGWKNIAAIASGDTFTVGLKSNGTVVVVGSAQDVIFDTAYWKDIVAISAGGNTILGLKNDGTVISTGGKDTSIGNIVSWSNIGKPTSIKMKQQANETDQSALAPETSQYTKANEIAVEVNLEGELEEYILSQYSSNLGYSIYYDKENFNVIPGQCIIGKPYEADQIILASNDGSYLDSYVEVGFIPNIFGSQANDILAQGFQSNYPNENDSEKKLITGKYFDVSGKGCYYAVMIYPEEATEGAAEIMQKMLDTFEIS